MIKPSYELLPSPSWATQQLHLRSFFEKEITRTLLLRERVNFMNHEVDQKLLCNNLYFCYNSLIRAIQLCMSKCVGPMAYKAPVTNNYDNIRTT